MHHPRISRSKKEKSFSSRGKIEKYNNDGTETIIVMGRPFRVVQKIGDSAKPLKSRSSHAVKDSRSYVFLVENTENIQEFPHRLVLRRSFYNVNEVLHAHREPEICGRIRDKSIARVFHCEVTRSEGTLGVTVAMEFFPSNLNRRLKQEVRMTESEIVSVLLAVTSAVGYLHSRKPPIAHRDIRPENILISSSVAGAGAYRLCNFANATTEGYQCENREETAAALEDMERLSQTAYRAPEMIDPGSGRRIDERVDLWSIGVLLYYMMFNRLPFADSSLGIAGQSNLRIPLDSGHCGALRVALEHLLQPDPARRWDIFALTNFMRFDEDISRHIGTFFFTATEWPDGWEQQDLRVMNRPQPPKAPPVCLNDGNPKSGGERKKKHENETEGKKGGGAGAAATERHAQRRNSPRPAPNSDRLDMAAEVAAALGLSLNSSDPEVIAYHNKLIREQEEAWDRAKASAEANKQKKKNIESPEPPREKERVKPKSPKKETEAQPAIANTVVARLVAEPKPKPTKDIFDDLFDSTPVPTAPTESIVLHSEPNFPQSIQQPQPQPPMQQQPMQQQQQKVENEGYMWSQTLFSGAQPQQTFPGAMDPNGWSTGAPTEYNGAYQQPMPMAPYQQQQAPMDFMQGSIPQAMPKIEEPMAKPKHKDPFEDLFH